MENKFRTYLNLNDTTRYIVLFNNEEGRQCRIDCAKSWDLANLGEFKLYAPIYIYKVENCLAIHGKARKKYMDKLVLKQTAGIKIVRQIEDPSKFLTKQELSILISMAAKTIVYPDSTISAQVQKIIYGGGVGEYEVWDIKLMCTKHNYIDMYVVKNLLGYKPWLLPKLKILFKKL